MISFLSRHRRTLFIATVAVFLLGTFVGLGGYLFTSRDVTQAVASVGSVKISYQTYRSRVDDYVEALRSRNVDVTDAALKEIKAEVLRESFRTGKNILTSAFGKYMSDKGDSTAMVPGGGGGPGNGHNPVVETRMTHERMLLDNFFQDCKNAKIEIAYFFPALSVFLGR